MQDIQWLEGGITTVPGILASGIAAGIKPSGKKDLALIYSSAPARVAAVFTRNQVKGAPVVVSQEHARDGRAQAIVASAGCANVCTGQQGLDDAREMTRTVGELLHVPASSGSPCRWTRSGPHCPSWSRACRPRGGVTRRKPS
jgi:glutamate N-acetyltransferase/amino-acid N-acetyltransferase